MALERNPQDSELLNAVFRAFHTVKGGAGFLQLPALVVLCHAAEDVLNAVRGQRRAFDDEVMDAVLQAVDAAQRMMAELYANAPLVPASPELLMQLHDLVGKTAPVVAVAATGAAGRSASNSDDGVGALLAQIKGTQVTLHQVATPTPRL